MYRFAAGWLLISIMACNTPPPSPDPQLMARLDSINRALNELKAQQAKVADTTPVKPNPLSDTATSVNRQRPKLLPKGKDKHNDTVHMTPAVPKTTHTPAAVVKAAPDTVVHRYKDGKVSVRILPFVNGKRKVYLYDRRGAVTIVLEDVRESYTVSNTLHFRADGSVESVDEHTNPGASMYWYDCHLSFDNNNEPQVRTCEQHPQNRVTMPGENDWHWDKTTKDWKRDKQYLHE